MKFAKKIMSTCLAAMMTVSCIPNVYAVVSPAEEPHNPALIDYNAPASLTVYKYDITSAERDGVWDSSYVSTGVYDENVNNTLGGGTENNLGNGETAFGYAIPGVEFTYLRVADIVQYTESTNDGETFDHVEVLYGIDKTKGTDLLKTLGLENGAERYAKADHLDSTKYYYQSDVLIDALDAALETNATTVKNALESYVAGNGGTAMDLTNQYGKSEAKDLDTGLYLVVETMVPEYVVSTCNPFFVSLPMTSVNGGNAEDGGTRWIYDVTAYPKNLTGIPSLEKFLRENVNDTGNNNGSATDISDGYDHTGTASDGDVIDYQIISTLPSITSEATYLSTYTFVDTMSAGLSYNKNDVVIEIFKDEGCTDLVTTWREADGKFTVAYNTTDNKESVMTISMTERGLAEINTAKTVYTGANMVNSGYSDCTMRITYAATMHSDDSVIYGDSGNPNKVVLTWQRSSEDYYDTLVDDAHLYTYALELTKLFADGKGKFEDVTFVMKNDSDGYYVKAQLDQNSGIYYVVDHVANKEDATRFVPVANADNTQGLVIVKGLEDDRYTIYEETTSDGYTLLADDIEIVISNVETVNLCDIYTEDVAGLIQNDPRFAEEIIKKAIANGNFKTNGKLADLLNNMPQKHLEHHELTASATVDGNDVNMLEDDGSVNASVPLKVINTRGFDLPQTGDHGTWMFSVIGILMMAGAVAVLVMVLRKKKSV